MKTYYEEVKAWLDGPDDGRVASEALVGLVQEHEKALECLKASKLALDQLQEPLRWFVEEDALAVDAIKEALPLVDKAIKLYAGTILSNA